MKGQIQHQDIRSDIDIKVPIEGKVNMLSDQHSN